MAAVLAEGTTTIYNAACEPYIQQLCHLLNRMGANISGIAPTALRWWARPNSTAPSTASCPI